MGKCFINHCIDLLDHRVGHGIAADRPAIAVYHNGIAGIAILLVVRVWITNIYG